MNPNIQKARQYEDQTLIAVGLVGWLTTAQVAAWLWPGADKHCATNKAAKALTRLTAAGLLMRRKSGVGVWAYLLTRTGAVRANHAYEMPAFRPGYDLSMLDVYRQSAIVDYLLAHQADIKLGPAGVRGWARCGLLDALAQADADALTWSPDTCSWHAALLVRSLHTDVLAKARRVRAASGSLRLLGSPYVVAQFEKAMQESGA